MIVALDVLFVGGFDEEASPLGAKGLGELTAVSVAPAIANAVDHATGERGARSADRGGESAANDGSVTNPVFGCRIHRARSRVVASAMPANRG